MSEADPDKTTAVATTVITALQPLSTDERERVLRSAAALYKIPMASSETSESDADHDSTETEGGENHAGGSRPGKRKSIVEFLNEHAPATNAQRIACFAQYRETVEGKGEYFSRDDLYPYFGSARLTKPSNFSRDFREAVGAGWIHEDGASSYLTQKGETAVTAGFEGKRKPRGAAAAKKRRKPRAKKTK